MKTLPGRRRGSRFFSSSSQANAKILRFLCGLCALFLLSCKTPAAKDSGLEHTVGDINRRSNIDYKPCRQEQDARSLYLRELGHYIAQANPQAFNGDMAIENFCFQVEGDGSTGSQNPPLRRITFGHGFIDHAPDDASLAGIIAHELAHGLMSHIHGKQIHPLLQTDANYNKLIEEIDQQFAFNCSTKVRGGLSGITFELARMVKTKGSLPELESLVNEMNKSSIDAPQDANSRLYCHYGYMNYLKVKDLVEKNISLFNVEDKLFKTWMAFSDNVKKNFEGPALDKVLAAENYADEKIAAGQFANISWQEEEADEVGFELFIRAKLHADSYSWVMEHLLQTSAFGDDEYVRCIALLKEGKVPPRGGALHPLNCFRIYNARTIERDVHRDEYKALLEQAVLKDIPSLEGRLAGLKSKRRR